MKKKMWARFLLEIFILIKRENFIMAIYIELITINFHNVIGNNL